MAEEKGTAQVVAVGQSGHDPAERRFQRLDRLDIAMYDAQQKINGFLAESAALAEAAAGLEGRDLLRNEFAREDLAAKIARQEAKIAEWREEHTRHGGHTAAVAMAKARVNAHANQLTFLQEAAAELVDQGMALVNAELQQQVQYQLGRMQRRVERWLAKIVN